VFTYAAQGDKPEDGRERSRHRKVRPEIDADEDRMPDVIWKSPRLQHACGEQAARAERASWEELSTRLPPARVATTSRLNFNLVSLRGFFSAKFGGHAVQNEAAAPLDSRS